jgi:ferredoxin-NADP reductase/MOSC domain-containing protein YiiM/ferredoxin
VARLIAVNVGMPKDVEWQGRTVHTGIWKHPVDGPVIVRRLNIDGDGQGDLAGHGGEQRAVMVYQTDSYDYWKNYLGRDDLRPGSFGENFTVDGLSDSEVFIGDRYRIGEAEFEVSQPRVTCFRVGIRLDEPEMPSLLVSHHRPGFYFRVLTEGYVQAGDEIIRTQTGRHQLSVADVDALLYLPGRNTDHLHQAIDEPALSPGWLQSFREMLATYESDSPATGLPVDVEARWHGFRPLGVAATHRESPTVLSIELESVDHNPLPTPLPGQYLTIKIPDAGDPPPLRSYSLSGSPDADRYRISVKREDAGVVSRWLHSHVAAGSVVEAAAPRGDFCLVDDDSPVVLLSAGIGATPLMAMAHALAATHSGREIWWLYTTRNAESHAFAKEIKCLIESMPRARQRVFYTSGEPEDDFIVRGRLDHKAIAALDLPTDATVYLCGPASFMDAMRDALTDAGIDPLRIHTELFGALPPINPGIVAPAIALRPHQPDGGPGAGPRVTFSRSGLGVCWASIYHSILELAEACDVPTRYSCRSGVCHTCATPIIEGEISYRQQPLEEPPAGEILICLATPSSDIVVDL